MNAKSAKKPKKKEPGEQGNGSKPVSGHKASWTPERRAAHAERMRGNKRGRKKGSDEATVLGVFTFLKFASAEIVRGLNEGELTLRNLPRKDVLTLLAFVDVRDRR